ncbi:MAG: 2-keto-4-pentenoate hydratase [Betaproteobacteria bacterium]
MLTAAQEFAAQFLVAARKAGRAGPRIDEPARPVDVADAIAVQRRAAQLLDLPVGGWKCSVPTAARAIVAAPIFAPTIHHASPCPMLIRGAVARIEPEIAFVMAHDLPARSTPYTEADVQAAIGEARLVLELIGPRYAEPSTVTYPELLADFIANQGLFVGPVVSAPWERNLEEFTIVIHANGKPLQTVDGKHPDVHPLRPLVWLADYLATRGDFLRAGQIVTTGSYAGIIDVPIDVPLTFEYGDFGRLAVTLTRAAP